MDIKITKTQPEWSDVNHGKRIVQVEFPNCDFKWLPTYKQIADIINALTEIEEESWK